MEVIENKKVEEPLLAVWMENTVIGILLLEVYNKENSYDLGIKCP